MSTEFIAILLGIISIVIYLVYYIWKKRFRKSEREWFSGRYKDGGAES